MVPEECFSMEITLQRALVHLGGAKDLLARPTRSCHAERGTLKAVPVRNQCVCTFDQLAFINGISLSRQLQVVQRSGCRVVQVLGRREIAGEDAT
jgi:hypothetical protein